MHTVMETHFYSYFNMQYGENPQYVIYNEIERKRTKTSSQAI